MTEAIETEKPELVYIQDMSTFIALVTRWHKHKVQILEYMLNVPAGTVMQANEGQEIVLEGALLDGFKAGLGLALMELGHLPFVTDSADAPTQH